MKTDKKRWRILLDQNGDVVEASIFRREWNDESNDPSWTIYMGSHDSLEDATREAKARLTEIDDSQKTDHSLESFAPDWSQCMTKDQSEKELMNFKFEGPGWYFTETDTMLVQPTWTHDVFMFHVWNRPNANETFKWAVSAPVRKTKA